MSKEQLNERQLLANQEMDKYFKVVDDAKEKGSLSSYDILKLLHGELTGSVEYVRDRNFGLGGIFGPEKEAQCEEIAKVMAFLPAKYGIESYTITDFAYNHAFNMTRLKKDGKIYYMDASF